MSVEADGGAPFLRRFAHSKGDATNQAEYLRLLLERARAGARVRERQPLVLIVEDDPDNLVAYEAMLEVEGFRTASARSLGDARRLLREIKPSAVLLDHVLPDGEGTALAQELRASRTDAAIPIVLLTGLDPSVISRAYGDGPEARLGKPCRPETLTGVLKLVVQRVGRRTPPARRTEPARLDRAQCPLCGVGGALLDGAGRFHCQLCGKEGRMERELYIDTPS